MSTPGATEAESLKEPPPTSRRLRIPTMRPPSPPILRGLTAVVAVLVLVGLLAAVLAHAEGRRPTTAAAPRPTATIALPTATPTPASATVVTGPQLVWRSASYPGHDTSAAVPVAAPSNGDVAYVCVENDSGSDAHIYVTRNGGASWSAGGGLNVGPQPSQRFSLESYLMVDSHNPATAIIDAGWVERGATGSMSEFANFATFDYGAHWSKLAYARPFLLIDQLASYQGTYYAFGITQMPGGIPQLWVSHDQLHSWAPLSLPNSAEPGALWENPSGALLLETSDQVSNSPFLLQSTDGGASWQRLAQVTTPVAWVVQTPLGVGPWHICRLDASAPLAVSCSADSGQTWTRYAFPWHPTVTPKGAPSVDGPTLFAVATDGSLLAQDQFGTQHIYSLPSGSTVWQDLGLAPSVWIPGGPQARAYAPTSTGGILWSADGTQTAAYPPQ